jgi:predicted outer membrane protein
VTRLLAALGLGLLVALTPVGPAALAGPERDEPAFQGRKLLAQADQEVVDTEWGPLGPGDRELLIRVRYAGLWEIPAGQMAQERGVDERVREIGGFIAEEHAELDERVREVAGQLGVTLPDQALAQHQNFLDRMAGASGQEFDLEFVQLLREAHGVIYPLIAYARSGTQNDLVREFAKISEEFVGRHMDYLESTGLVDWFHIPPPPGPGGQPSRFLAAEPGGIDPLLIWLILGAATVAGAITVVRTVRPR